MGLVDQLREVGRWLMASDGGLQNSVPISSITRGSEAFEWFSGAPANGLPSVTERTAQALTAVNACVNLISGGIMISPVNVFDCKPNGERAQVFDHPMAGLFNMEFSGRWPAAAGWDFLSRSRLFHGDSFARIIRQGSTVVGLRPYHPQRVQVAPWLDGSRLAYVVTPEPWEASQERLTLDQDDMLHVPGWGFDGLRSVSPLRYALQQAGAVALAAQQFSGQFFANQARPDYVLTTEKALTDEQIERLRAAVDEKHGRASGNAGKPMLLQGGLKIEQVSLTNADAELIASRGFQTEEIARVFGVPPFMIGHNEKTTSWGSGVEEMGAGFVRYTLQSHLTAFQNEINRKLFRNRKQIAEFDTFELERGNMKSMLESFRIAIGRAGEPGFMTRNEVRKRLFMNPIAGGDTFEGAQDAQPAV